MMLPPAMKQLQVENKILISTVAAITKGSTEI